MFEDAMNEYRNRHTNYSKIKINFKFLSGGYGEHLFNEIVRDIISSDISVFEVSDRNPNVMIELSLALVSGSRTLPIRERTAPKPPSDISGQMYAEYTNNGLEYESGHHERLLSMIDYAIRKKQT